jgi:hypothetical protein
VRCCADAAPVIIASMSSAGRILGIGFVIRSVAPAADQQPSGVRGQNWADVADVWPATDGAKLSTGVYRRQYVSPQRIATQM